MASSNQYFRRFVTYAVATIASIVCVWVLWELWKADLRFPLVSMSGDALFAQAVIFKGMTDNSWYFDNPLLGAPFGLNMRDLPQSDLLVLGSAKTLALFTKNHILIRNLIAIGSYPLVTVTSLYAMRRLGVRYAIALSGSLLFAFSAYHHWHIGPHILLGIGYFTVPFATLLSLELFDNTPIFSRPTERNGEIATISPQRRIERSSCEKLAITDYKLRNRRLNGWAAETLGESWAGVLSWG